MSSLIVLVILVIIPKFEAARILMHYPTPSISHQVVFQPLTQELVKRGHEVVVITTDPMYKKGEVPANLTEIDFHDISYKMWKEYLHSADMNDKSTLLQRLFQLTSDIVVLQWKSEQVQKIFRDKSIKFDLLILESYLDITLGLRHKYNVPVIQFSSTGASLRDYRQYGAAAHPFLFPPLFHERVNNLTLLEKIGILKSDYDFDRTFPTLNQNNEKILREIFGSDVPSINELRNKVDMLFLNINPSWEFNRPVPPNVIYLGGMHLKPEKALPEEIKSYLDNSKHGVIFVSFGSNVDPALFPLDKIQTFVRVFSKLPYDVLWKWNLDELPGRTENIKISKWLPQSDLLRHPKIKLFITQCGLQSTDETIIAGVPVLGIPIYGDQYYNAELYEYHKIGVRLDLSAMNEENLSHSIREVIGNKRYRENIVKLRAIMTDQPQSPLERAVWWTEYVMRHGGARHLRSPAANMSWQEYYALDLVLLVLLALVSVLICVLYIVRCITKLLARNSSFTKLKIN